MTTPILLEEAWERLLGLASSQSPEAETIAVDETAGRYLAHDLVARRTQPDADLSAMDGFAVGGSGPWEIVGESRAGTPFASGLAAGQAVRISTGASCPPGTSGIVLSEEASVRGSTLTAPLTEAGRWIRRRGFDFAEGAQLLARGSAIGPAQLALARAAGHGVLEVARCPVVAVLEIGDELVADPRSCPPGRLPTSNGAMVGALASGAGAQVNRIPPLPDDRAGLVRAILGAGEADVIVTTAGASVGEHDHVRGALEDCGAELAFWRVAIRPGKPLMVARLGRQLVLGLPGNPASAFVTAYLFLLPLLRALQGATRPLPAATPLPLSSALPPGGPRREFVRAQFRDGAAHPLDEPDSSALRTLATADLLIDRPIAAPAAPAGLIVSCYWLGIGAIA